MNNSDFSYSMLVDSRSRRLKILNGRGRLRQLCLMQSTIHLIGLIFYTIKLACAVVANDKSISAVPFFAISAGSFALSIAHSGESYMNQLQFLRVYMVISSVALLVWIHSVVQTDSTFEIIENPSCWETKKCELFEAALVLLGLLVQIFQVKSAISLTNHIIISYVIEEES